MIDLSPNRLWTKMVKHLIAAAGKLILDVDKCACRTSFGQELPMSGNLLDRSLVAEVSVQEPIIC